MSRSTRLHKLVDAADGAWACECGKGAGNTQQATGEEHLQAAAKAAFARLDGSRAHATMAVSADRSRLEMRAIRLLSHHWFGDSRLRAFMDPYYDYLGVLSAQLRWEDLAAAVTAGKFDDDEDLLVLQVALSLLDLFPISLVRLENLADMDRSTVREILLELLGDVR